MKERPLFFLSCREVYVDPDTGVPYDILMSKVDVKYGMFGLNNFYKMQVRLVLHKVFKLLQIPLASICLCYQIFGWKPEVFSHKQK